MRPDFSDVLILTGAGMVLAGAWLLAGLPGALITGGLMVLGAGWTRATQSAKRRQ